MGKPYVKLIFDRRHEMRTKSEATIEILVFFSRNERKYIALGKSTPEEFEKIKRKKFVADEIKKYEAIVAEMIELEEPLTVESFNFHAGMKGSHRMTAEERKAEQRRGSFPQYMRECIMSEKLGNSILKRRLRVVAAVEASGFMKTFNDITVANIYKFEEYLQKPYELKRAKNVQLVT